MNGVEEDLAWNPIWYARSEVSRDGWTAEMKIPFSQLRFSKADIQVWGLQVQRRILRNEELSVWQRIPQDAPGWVSEFGLLSGLNNISSQHQLEIQPFVVGALKTFERNPQNPFRNKHDQSVQVGLDGKVGLTNDVTLDFTINPDFGQVEADPAAIVLDGFQLFFQEQRPFFIENKNLFDYRFSSPIIGSPYSSDNLFYSRRIGRTPQRSVALDSNTYAHTPQQTTILGAFKLSGKSHKGLSFGVLESLTSQEQASISDGQSTLVEPQTNYFVARVLQDLNNRKTFIGAMYTSVIRSRHLETDFLHHTAQSLGIDLLHQWQDRNWYSGMNLVMSHVNGSSQSILRTQTSIPHLFQRDASHLSVDSTRTFLTGTGGDIKIGKSGNGNFQGEVGITWRSPNLELNDIGFLREADIIQQYTGINYRSINSFGIFRRAGIGYKHWFNWDFEGKLNYIDWDISTEATFQNNWSILMGFFNQPHIFSKSLLQGGPRIRLTNQYGWWWALNSDARKKFFINYSGWTKDGKKGSYFLLENSVSLNYQPFDRFRFAFGPRYTIVRHRLQFNGTIDSNTSENLVSMLDQNTFSIVARADLVLNANMAIQYYAEPFISQGIYSNFALVNQPLALFDQEQLRYIDSYVLNDNRIELDLDHDGMPDDIRENPNFSFAQFRANLVYRWEYRPGSEFYLVWSQGLTDTAQRQLRPIHSLEEQVFSKKLDSTFLLKFTYRFHR